MKFRSLILATAVMATASGYAFAQSAPTERTGSKTDTQQSQQQMHKDKMKSTTTGSGMTGSGTTGSGMSGSGMSGSNHGTGMGSSNDKANGQMLNKNVSPASPESGDKQQK